MLMPIAGAGAVNVTANASTQKIEISLNGYAGASAGQYPRKTASGLEWVAGTGGGATVETGTFSAPIYQAGFGDTSTRWVQIPNKTVSGRYSYIGDILTITLIPPSNMSNWASITQNKVFYVSLRSLMDIFNIPFDARNIFTGAQCVNAATPITAYALTYVEENTMFAIQFQKTIGYGTSTNAYGAPANFSFACPAMCFTINGVTKK